MPGSAIRNVALAALAVVALARCSAKEKECGEGLTLCGSECVDLQSDAAACGACFHACPAGGSCVAGVCSCPGDQPDVCGAGGTVGGGACVNLQTGAGGFCGTCGLSCQGTWVSGPDAACESGACVCAGTPAATDCGTNPRCVNTLVDPYHCGTCTTTCALARHWSCQGGVCGCYGAYATQCGADCVDVSDDPLNCGACSSACVAEGKTCAGGTCICAAAGLFECAPYGCFDLETDRRHCGDCATVCASGTTCCSGGCRDVATDEANCGSCGHACPPTATCTSGSCLCPAATPVACGTSCCAGTQCCGTGSSCQPAHDNGLGGHYYFGCSGPLAQSATTRDAALAAADSWGSGSTYEGIFSANCLARQTATQCAIWCWAGSTAPGQVAVNYTSSVCDALNPAYGSIWN